MEQIKFKDNTITITNPASPTVSTIKVQSNKRKYKLLLNLMCKALNEEKCLLYTYDKNESNCTELNLTTLLERGFIKLLSFEEYDLYIGKLPETKIDIVVLHEVMDNKSIKQVYLSPKLHGCSSNLDYLRALQKDT